MLDELILQFQKCFGAHAPGKPILRYAHARTRLFVYLCLCELACVQICLRDPALERNISP